MRRDPARVRLFSRTQSQPTNEFVVYENYGKELQKERDNFIWGYDQELSRLRMDKYQIIRKCTDTPKDVFRQQKEQIQQILKKREVKGYTIISSTNQKLNLALDFSKKLVFVLNRDQSIIHRPLVLPQIKRSQSFDDKTITKQNLTSNNPKAFHRLAKMDNQAFHQIPKQHNSQLNIYLSQYQEQNQFENYNLRKKSCEFSEYMPSQESKIQRLSNKYPRMIQLQCQRFQAQLKKLQKRRRGYYGGGVFQNDCHTPLHTNRAINPIESFDSDSDTQKRSDVSRTIMTSNLGHKGSFLTSKGRAVLDRLKQQKSQQQANYKQLYTKNLQYNNNYINKITQEDHTSSTSHITKEEMMKKFIYMNQIVKKQEGQKGRVNLTSLLMSHSHVSKQNKSHGRMQAPTPEQKGKRPWVRLPSAQHKSYFSKYMINKQT